MPKLYETPGEIAGHRYTTQVFGLGGPSRILWETRPPAGTKLVVPGMDWGDGEVDPDEDVTVTGIVAGGELACVGMDGCENAYHPNELREPACAA